MEHKSNNIIKNDKIATSVVEFQAQEILPKIILTIGADMPFKIFFTSRHYRRFSWINLPNLTWHQTVLNLFRPTSDTKQFSVDTMFPNHISNFNF
jgi:hypothetical protein